MGEDGLLPGGGVYVSVNFCGCDVLVTKHVLDYTEVCTVFDKMGGKGVAKSVWRDFLVDAGKHGLTLDNVKHRNPAEGLTEAIQEQNVIELA